MLTDPSIFWYLPYSGTFPIHEKILYCVPEYIQQILYTKDVCYKLLELTIIMSTWYHGFTYPFCLYFFVLQSTLINSLPRHHQWLASRVGQSIAGPDHRLVVVIDLFPPCSILTTSHSLVDCSTHMLLAMTSVIVCIPCCSIRNLKSGHSWVVTPCG